MLAQIKENYKLKHELEQTAEKEKIEATET